MNHRFHEVTVIDTEADAAVGDGVRLATMRRVEGLEFPRMPLAVTAYRARSPLVGG